MSLPTLMIKGKLVPPNGDPKLKADLDGWIPYEYILEWFRERIHKTGIENRVLILKSETASGKSTLLPPKIYQRFIHTAGTHAPGMICTQPRVLTAKKNVIEMIRNYSEFLRLGDTVGWSTKHDKLNPHGYGLLSATVGTLQQQLTVMSDDEIMTKYKFILIDETHERDLQTDQTISMLKNLLVRNKHKPECPFVVLMSATFDPQSFIDYFNIPLVTNFIWCRGETAGFDEMWDWNNGNVVSDYMKAAAEVVEKICIAGVNDGPNGDILIFLPGHAEFVTTAALLTKLNKRLHEQGIGVFSLLQIDGAAVDADSRDVRMLETRLNEQPVTIEGEKLTPVRRVILSTVVAETGLTLSNLKYVIDSGYNREVEFNPLYGINALVTKPAPQSRIRQRKGRAGRKFRGVFYPLYPLEIYNSLPELQYPQILIQDVSGIMLAIIVEQLKVKKYTNADVGFRTADIDMIDIPTPDALKMAMRKLYTLGYISPIAPAYDGTLEIATTTPDIDYNGKFGITALGKTAYLLNMPPEHSRMILASYSWDAHVLDMITIAAYLTVSGRNFVKREETPTRLAINWLAVYKLGLPDYFTTHGLYKTRLIIADDFIDGLILFNAIKRVITNNPTDLKKWCNINNIAFATVLDFIGARESIIEQMLSNGFSLFKGSVQLKNVPQDEFMDTITRIKHCIYDGYRNNILVLENGSYKRLGSTVTKPKIFEETVELAAEDAKHGYVRDLLPTTILYDELGLKLNRKTNVFEIMTGRISTMDGFVSTDPDFI